jgi:hypothetical protein
VSFVLPCFARATNEHCTKSPSTAQRSLCRAKAPLRYAFGRSTSSSFGTDSLNSQFFLYALFVFHRQNRIRVTSRDGADMLLQAGKYYSRSSQADKWTKRWRAGCTESCGRTRTDILLAPPAGANASELQNCPRNGVM